MSQFLIKPEQIKENKFILRNAGALHLIKVLRAKPHEKIRLFDGKKNAYLAEITAVNRDSVEGIILKEIAPGVRKIKINLFPSLIKADRFELMLEKVTEVGVDSITPVLAARTIIKLDEKKSADKKERWEKIVLSASEQCNTSLIPCLGNVLKFDEAVKVPSRDALNLIADETEKEGALKVISASLQGKPSVVNLFVGPEGGFTAEEIKMAMGCGFRPLKIEGNIMRAETAAIVACALVLYEFSTGSASSGVKPLTSEGNCAV